MTKKEKNNKINKKNDETKKEKVKTRFFTCTTCEEQCAGHGGGGTATLNGGCLCFDGVYLECLI